MASMNMIHQLIDISQEQYERHKQEVDQLTQRIDEANWGDITTKNYAILNNIMDNYEADMIQRKNRKFRRDLRDYQQGRVYTFSKKYDHVQDSNLSLDTTSCPDSIPSSEVETSDNSDRDSSIRPKVNFLEEARRFRLGSLQESRPKPPDITTATPAYIGSTIRPLKLRIQEHFRNILKLETQAPLVDHYKTFHHNERRFEFSGIRRLTSSPRGGNLQLRLRQEESRMIIQYDTVNNGLNQDHEWHYWLL
ncbi:hypothetical protein NDU88_002363 [Pleurodeles waltl]|uniref:Uncharacterized protein n=1 Tax=Pleurodeles waltl TaxID=8319 RepID=A0AAV7R9T7_PLEWA|nr:hypothetical protein NDU88_002363 [Pleurodeles waltl]